MISPVDNRAIAKSVVDSLILNGEGETVSEIVKRSVLQALDLKDNAIREIRDSIMDEVSHVFIDAKNKRVANVQISRETGRIVDEFIYGKEVEIIDELRPRVISGITYYMHYLI